MEKRCRTPSHPISALHGYTRLWRIYRTELVRIMSTAEFRVVQAVAFGDFLLERPVAQAADVGISVVSSKDRKTSVEADGVFLKRLRARNPALHLEPYRPWMSARWHRRLL